MMLNNFYLGHLAMIKIKPLATICRDGKKRFYTAVTNTGELIDIFTESDDKHITKFYDTKYGCLVDEVNLVGIVKK